MNFRKLGVAFAAALALAAAPAYAETSIGAGVFYTHDGSTESGILGSYNLFGLPELPIKIQLSAAVPFGSGGRFAATVEGEYQMRKIYVGAGVGGGKFAAGGNGGALYDLLGGIRLAPFTSFQARYYGSGSTNTGSATYLGLAFGLK
jgi:hypothetical protein